MFSLFKIRDFLSEFIRFDKRFINPKFTLLTIYYYKLNFPLGNVNWFVYFSKPLYVSQTVICTRDLRKIYSNVFLSFSIFTFPLKKKRRRERNRSQQGNSQQRNRTSSNSRDAQSSNLANGKLNFLSLFLWHSIMFYYIPLCLWCHIMFMISFFDFTTW